MDRSKLKGYAVFLAILLAVLVPVAIAVYANIQFHMRITWTMADTSIGVYQDAGATIPWVSPYDLAGVSGSQTFDFYIKNEGNVLVTVTIVGETIVGGTQTWNPISLPSLAVGEVAQMSLTITFTATGSYDFDFDSVEA